MNKQIAVLVNDDGKIASFLESGVVNIYEKEDKKWIIKKEITFQTDRTADMNMLRIRVIKLVNALEKCKIFVAAKVSGIPYNILDRSGINCWEINGDPCKSLDYVLQSEEEEEQKSIKESIEAENNKEQWITKDNHEGSYSIDLIKMQNTNPTITTKQVLLPFFKDTQFSKLTIKCCHVPGWFGKEISKFNLKYDVKESETNKMNVVVTHK